MLHYHALRIKPVEANKRNSIKSEKRFSVAACNLDDYEKYRHDMKRRTFLKSALILPLFKKSIYSQLDQHSQYFEYFEVTGSYKEIGFKIGKRFSKNIHQVIERRAAWHNKLTSIIQTENGREISQKLLEITTKKFPQYLQEIEGMAQGASVSFDKIWVFTIKSELGALEKEPHGCSTIFYKNRDKMWLFHNEDGNSAYTDLMFVVKVNPPSGISFISLVYPGTLMGNGPSINSRGIIQTSNYISSTQTEIGVPRYVIGRAILEARTLDEAVQIATITPRTFPYHHNIAGIPEQKYFSVETVPNVSTVNEPKDIFYHTNHLLLENTRDYKFQDGSYINSSSKSRFEVIDEKLGNLNSIISDPEFFLNVLSSHQNEPYSPCRHPKGSVQGKTLATAFFNITNGQFRLFRGNTCQSVKNENCKDFLI